MIDVFSMSTALPQLVTAETPNAQLAIGKGKYSSSNSSSMQHQV